MRPENPREALSIGLNPCDFCDVGWGHWSMTESKTCADTCEYWKEYCKTLKLPILQKG